MLIIGKKKYMKIDALKLNNLSSHLNFKHETSSTGVIFVDIKIYIKKTDIS